VSLNHPIQHDRILESKEGKFSLKLTPGYKHFFMQELCEQDKAILKCINFGARLRGGKDMVKLGGLDQNQESLEDIESMIIAGCGTSFLAACYGEYIMKEFDVFS